MNEFFFEGNRQGALPPCGPAIPPGLDDHMARAPYEPAKEVLMSGIPEDNPSPDLDPPPTILPTQPEDFPNWKDTPEPNPEPELPATRPPGES